MQESYPADHRESTYRVVSDGLLVYKSLNHLQMRFVGKAAKFQGVDLPAVGSDDRWAAIRRGAGLDPSPAPTD